MRHIKHSDKFVPPLEGVTSGCHVRAYTEVNPTPEKGTPSTCIAKAVLLGSAALITDAVVDSEDRMDQQEGIVIAM